MTDLLKDMLNDRADSLPAPELDVLAMVRDGNRRTNRRRTGVIGAAVAAVAAVVTAVIVVPGLVGRGPEQDAVVTASPGTSLAYAVDSTIHTGESSVDVGRPIAQFVQTPTGFVVADERWAVFSVIGTEIVRVGQMDPDKASGFTHDADVVAWVEDAPDGAQYAVLDQAAGTEVVRGRVGVPPVLDDDCTEVCSPLRIIAVNGRSLYLDDARGVVAWSALDAGSPELIPAVENEYMQVLDVADGVIARVVGVQTRVGPDLQGGQVIDVLFGDLSPDGHYLLSQGEYTEGEGSQPTLFDAATGKLIPVVTGAHDASGYSWIDDSSFAVLAFNKNGDGQRLLRCEVGGECSVEVVLDGLPPVLLPAP